MTSVAAIPAFACLSADAVAEVNRYARPVRYRAGAVVRPAGSAPEAVLLLLTGTIVAGYAGPSGGETWPARWDGPAIVDKPATLGGPTPSGALLATTPAAGMLLSHDRFLRLLDEHEPVRHHVLGQLAADAWHGSQEDLARALGLSRVTVNRALGRLARAAAVRLTTGGVRVTDPARLATHADPS